MVAKSSIAKSWRQEALVELRFYNDLLLTRVLKRALYWCSYESACDQHKSADSHASA
jgi:hypothetical protein